jgi:hypothetical protein
VPRPASIVPSLLIVAAALAPAGAAERFPLPLEALGPGAREKVEALLNDYTLKRSPRLDHPILNPPVHRFLLDRPDVGATLARVLRIGTYTVTGTGKDRFHASDPEGLEGDLEILYRDEAHRVYLGEGIAKGRVLTLRGKALVIHEFQYRTADQGQPWVATQLTIYGKIENPLLALFLQIFSPLVGGLVDAKISKAQGVVRQVSELMVQDPEGCYAQIEASDQLTRDDLTKLRDLMTLSEPFPVKR